MNEDILVDIGFSVNEAKIYRSLLGTGLATITHIAHVSKLHRANVYESINKLIEKGLVSYINRENATLYEAVDPENLLMILKDKEDRLRSIIPQLALSRKLSESKGEALIYEGHQAYVRLLYGLLQYKDPILVFGIPPVAPKIMKTMIPHFHTERLLQKVEMKHIYNHDAGERIEFLNKMPLTYAKALPSALDSQVSTTVCGPEVILALWITPVMSIRVVNKLIADSYKKYFCLLWDLAK